MEIKMRAETKNTSRKTKSPSPRETILDVLTALDWGGHVRIRNVSVHIHGVPRGGSWRDGSVSVETIPADGLGFAEPCSFPAMTAGEALTEAAELIEYADVRLKVAPDRVAAAREVLRMASGTRRGRLP
jgi:hypothetical protein